MTMKNRKRIGEILLEKGIITEAQLKEALEEQMHTGLKLGTILIKHNFATEEDIIRALCEQLGFPFVDLPDLQIEPEVLRLVSEDICRRFQIMPLFKIGDTLTIALTNPLDIASIDELRELTHLFIRPVVATFSGIKAAIDKYYKGKAEALPVETPEAIELPKEEPLESKTLEVEAQLKDLIDEATHVPVVNLVNQLIADAVDASASDIHLEPEEDKFFCRFRIDGILYDMSPPPKKFQAYVISCIKIMAGMDIAERRLPQDGRFQKKLKGKEIDLRVSTFPTFYGENVSIRILDKSQGLFKLEDLGFLPDILKKFKEIIHKPYGIILVTGPTGSGKTTTLYAVLNAINNLEKNILTLEDPIEYLIPRVRQSQINPKAGLTFAAGLRSLIRQDPNVIMIGEIRDKETADIAIHAALTGQLVFSTLHTNDASSAATRLIDMDVEPFLVSSSLSCILAQRLVRRLCPKCKKEYKPTDKELSLFSGEGSEARFFKETGCKDCHNTGFKGRIGIFELLIPNEIVKELINKKAPAYQLREAARKRGMMTLREDGLEKVKAGITTFAEILRVTEEA